ncbi:hypothetical protein BH11BAC3_BH11BAC3_07350 [soil metagenome]
MFKFFAPIFLTSALFIPACLAAQTADDIISDLQSIHAKINNDTCGNQRLISNRAMNLFLSDKIGTYLTNYKDLSFYKNNITFNAASGDFSLSHSLFQPNGIDEPVKSFNSIGVKANITNALAAAFTDNSFKNALGMTINRTWMGKVNSTVNDCFEKNQMDGQRQLQLDLIEQEIKTRSNNFILSLDKLVQGAMTDSGFSKLKQTLKEEFFEQLRDEYSRRFAQQQYLELANTFRFKKIATHWTTFSAYMPIILKRFVTAESLATSTKNKKAYAFEIALSHTRFWETKKSGRLFIKLEAGVRLNDDAETYSLQKMNFDQYKNSGGADSTSLSNRKINTIYVGDYHTFLTPVAKLGLVYFPPDSHIGISGSIEQNIGRYHPLNLTLGIPVVLINTIGAPAANFEFQIKYFDLTHVVYTGRKNSDNISVNLTIGVPFSKIIY